MFVGTPLALILESGMREKVSLFEKLWRFGSHGPQIGQVKWVQHVTQIALFRHQADSGACGARNQVQMSRKRLIAPRAESNEGLRGKKRAARGAMSRLRLICT